EHVGGERYADAACAAIRRNAADADRHRLDGTGAARRGFLGSRQRAVAVRQRRAPGPRALHAGLPHLVRRPAGPDAEAADASHGTRSRAHAGTVLRAGIDDLAGLVRGFARVDARALFGLR